METGQDRVRVLAEVADQLRAEAGSGSPLLSGAALLVFAADGALLSGSPEALASLGTGEALSPLCPALPRLRLLAAGAAPRDKVRLERLRFDPRRLAPPVTCACRLVRLASGEEVLAVAPLEAGADQPPPHRSQAGPVPGGAQPEAAGEAAGPDRAGLEPEAEAPVQDAPEPPSGPDEAPPPDPLAPLRGRGTVRFTWETDAEGRFTAVSPSLAEAVGPDEAAITGRTWEEIAGRLVLDPEGAVADLLSRAKSFRGQRVLWRLQGGQIGVPVDLAGAPAGGARRYRGFGLCRLAGVVEQAWPGLPDPVEASPPRSASELPASGEAAGIADEASPPASGAPSPRAPLHPFAEWTGLFQALEGFTMAFLGAPRPAPLRLEDAEPPAARPEPSPPPSAPPARATAAEGRPDSSRLSYAERDAFREIARALGARFEGDDPSPEPASPEAPVLALPSAPPAAERKVLPSAVRETLLDRLPIGLLVHRGEEPLYANRALLDLIGYESVAELAAEGGVPRLFPGRTGEPLPEDGTGPAVILQTRRDSLAAEVKLSVIDWDGGAAGLMLVRRAPEAELAPRLRALELDLRARESRIRELSAILDTAADGIILLDEADRILSLNRSAEALFGYDQNEVVGEPLAVLLAPESRAVAAEYLDGLRANGVASVLNDGRDVVGQVAQGGAIPLTMTLGQVSAAPERRFCAVLRDVTAARKAEAELNAAKRAAEAASVQRADFLARVSHEVRTPLNAIIGFAEMMLEERGGPLGERHADYIRDIRESGRQTIRVVGDLLDLARIEAGRMELAFTGISLTEAVMTTVAALQGEAAARRVVMRTSLAPKLPPVVADGRSVRQIVANIVTNAIRFTPAGGQVIVSTALTDRGEVVLRVRDTGLGMTREEIEGALEPFREIATRRGSPGAAHGTGLGLPLTKALVEANRGALDITSAKNEGTLVEVTFPATRVLVD